TVLEGYPVIGESYGPPIQSLFDVRDVQVRTEDVGQLPNVAEVLKTVEYRRRNALVCALLVIRLAVLARGGTHHRPADNRRVGDRIIGDGLTCKSASQPEHERRERLVIGGRWRVVLRPGGDGKSTVNIRREDVSEIVRQ